MFKKKNNIPMSKQSMWNVATEAVVNYLLKNNYQVETADAKCTLYPNIVAKKDNKLYGIIIDANEVRKQPKYSIGRTFDMLRFARRFDAIPLYASVGLGSRNPDKFDKELLLEADPEGYLVNFVDFDKIDYDLIERINKEDKKEYIINLFGDCYERSDFSMIEKFISKDCNWYSYYSGNEFKSKKEIMKYYKEKSNAMKTTKINYFLIKFIGDSYDLHVKELRLPDGTKQENATVRMQQPDGEIGLVVEQVKPNGEKVGMSIIIKFDDECLINDIFIGNPYAMHFKDFYDYSN